MLHLAKNNFITRLEIFSECFCQKIEAFRGSSRENNLLKGRSYKISHHLMGIFILHGSTLGKLMNSTMDIGIILRIKVIHRADDRIWFLRSCAVVKVNYSFSVDAAREQRKVQSNFF